VACLAQLVNVIAPIMTRSGGGCWAQTIFYPLMHASRFGRGTALRPIVSSPTYDCRDYEKVPLVDAAATLSDDGGITIFALNRDMSEDITLNCALRAFGEMKAVEHIVMHHDDVKAVNTEENPDEVKPGKARNPKMDLGRMNVKMPALSWNVIRLSKA
jgi:alpha-N-arabinofuranosidase